MSAEPEPQAEPDRILPPAWPRRAQKLRRQLFMERAFFLAVIALLMLLIVRHGRALTAYQIMVDGKPVALVSERGTAERLLDELRGDASEARFRQMVEIERVNPRAPAVLTEKGARAALAQAIKVVVPAHVILVNGRVAAALESREQAQQVLEKLRRTYAGPKQKARFKESVRIEGMEVPRAKVVSPDDAFDALAAGSNAGTPETYQVQTGDTAWAIASEHGLAVERLADLNPGADLERLQAGQTLTVGQGEAAVTVVTTEELTELETIPYSTHTQAAPDMPEGERRVLAKGVAGQKTVRYRITRENGRVVKREVLAETVMRPPKAERVLAGTGA